MCQPLRVLMVASEVVGFAKTGGLADVCISLPDGGKRDCEDNRARFAFFNRAVLEVLPLLDYWPDVPHAHDWQVGPVTAYLPGMRQDWSWDRRPAEYERLYRLTSAPRALLAEQVGR